MNFFGRKTSPLTKHRLFTSEQNQQSPPFFAGNFKFDFLETFVFVDCGSPALRFWFMSSIYLIRVTLETRVITVISLLDDISFLLSHWDKIEIDPVVKERCTRPSTLLCIKILVYFPPVLAANPKPINFFRRDKW